MYEMHLNIGLHAGDSTAAAGTVYTAQEALAAFTAAVPGEVLEHRVEQSDTEPTLVIRASVEHVGIEAHRRVFALAEQLNQDCIAARVTSNGETIAEDLIGPRAEAWGDFNPEFFIEP